MSKSADFQCPDTGLIVILAIRGGRVFVEGDPADWEEMGAEQGTIDATNEWLTRAQGRVQGRRLTVEEIEQRLAPIGVTRDHTAPLTWTDD